MTEDTLTPAATRLADILLAENTALQALDYAAAGRLLADKTAAAAALTRARAEMAAPPPGVKVLAARLTHLAEENRHLLERAIAVQRRVLAVVAQAAQTALPEAHYGRGGAPAHRAACAMALRASA